MYTEGFASTSTNYLSREQKEQFVRDGYLVMRGLLPPDLVEKTRDDVLAALQLELYNPDTWGGQSEAAWGVGHLTEACRTDKVEDIAAELVGPNFMRGTSYHYGKRSIGLEPKEEGYIPVLTFPSPGEPGEIVPKGFHLDGILGTFGWPSVFSLVVFAYLTDTAKDGGATLVRPGSHRQVFEHGIRNGDNDMHGVPDIPYADFIALDGKAGDVIFMHFLMVHSGSMNRSKHIRVGLNTAVMPMPDKPYEPKTGAPDETWTPLDFTLRTDIDGLAGYPKPKVLPLFDALKVLDT